MNLADQIERHISTAKDLERMQKEMSVKQADIAKFVASKREREVIIEVKYNAGQSVDGILTFDCVRFNGEKVMLEFVPSAATVIAMHSPLASTYTALRVEPL